MSVRVLFFGSTAAITGKRWIDINVADEMLASTFFDQMVTKYPRLASHRILFSINQQYATGGEIIRDGDELAIFTAVSGG